MRLGLLPVALEAAHMKLHQARGPDREVTGLALCSLHHKVNDRAAFTLSKSWRFLYPTTFAVPRDSMSGSCESMERGSTFPAKASLAGKSESSFGGEYRER